MKFCKDCVHYENFPETTYTANFDLCKSQPKPDLFDPVTGEVVRLANGGCSMIRQDATRCGLEARWYEPKGGKDGSPIA